MATGGYDYFSSDDFYREEDRFWQRYGGPRPKRYALDTYPLVKEVGFRVILIEQIKNTFFGTLEGEVVPSDDEFVLCIKSAFDGSIHRFTPPSSFEWYQDQFFIKFSLLRRHRYITPAALELRRQTKALYEAALEKNLFNPGDAEHESEVSSASLRWYLSARLGLPLDTDQATLMQRIQKI